VSSSNVKTYHFCIFLTLFELSSFLQSDTPLAGAWLKVKSGVNLEEALTTLMLLEMFSLPINLQVCCERLQCPQEHTLILLFPT
jgi:hypothetical protein